MGADQAGLPTGGVARLLGVSPTTIRSWERRYGIGPSLRDPGHHRRWSPEDIALLEAMCRLAARGVRPAEAARAVLASHHAAGAEAETEPAPAPAPAPEAGAGAGAGAANEAVAPVPGPEAGRGPVGGRSLRMGAVRAECRGLARAAVRLDSPEVARILREVVDSLGVVDAWTEVMMPALRATGRKWASSGEQYVEVEHLLSWHVSTVLRAAAVRPARPRPAPPVLLAAMPDEQHSLALEAAAAGLGERALPFRMLGAAVPPRALLDAVHRIGPGAVMLWSQLPPTADHELVRRVADSSWGARGSRGRALVLATGPGWGRSGAPGGTAGPQSLASALDLLERTVTG
ncbi:MerR family transcriptional regulator [Kitasatospora sp. NPDC054795]